MEKAYNIEEMNSSFLENLANKEYDYIDLGTLTGGGLELGKRFGGKKGLGFEISPAQIPKLYREFGYNVYCGDIRQIAFDEIGKVEFAVCSHILEHLENKFQVACIIEKLASACTDYVFIQGPLFDTETALWRKGIKLGHTNIRDHYTRFTLRDLMNILYDLKLHNYAIGVQSPIKNYNSSVVLSAAEPLGKWKYQEGVSLPKKVNQRFYKTIYRNFACCINLKDVSIDLSIIKEAAKVEKWVVDYNLTELSNFV